MAIDPNDRWYRAEIVPPNLAKLVAQLRAHYNLGPLHVGCKGSLTHQRGYHRSRAFLKNSPYSLHRTYSVTAAVNRGGDDNWLSAIDLTLPKPQLLEVSRRLDAAARAGRIEKVVEWYGNTNDDSRVDGFDNISNVVSSSDISHLWHVHISIARNHANDDHSDLFDIITGEDEDMAAGDVWGVPITSPHFGVTRTAGDWLKRIEAVERACTAIASQLGVVLDEVDDLEEIAATDRDPQAFADAVVAQLGPAYQEALMEALQRIRVTVEE